MGDLVLFGYGSSLDVFEYQGLTPLSQGDSDEVKFVNSAVGTALHLRGINAKVIQPDTIRVGDVVRKIAPA